MDEGLSKQVEAPVANPELLALKSRIGVLQIAYFVLFAASLVLIVINRGHSYSSTNTTLWAITLGAAVITRLYRQSQVNKYNALLAGGRNGTLT
jgi:hypothetical protein